MTNPKNLDMFQYLPEPLLLIILSCLPFEEAARTSVLSKRWKSIWRSTKNIHLNERFFVKPNHSDAEKEHFRMAFLNFTERWIGMHREATADRFCLTFSRPLVAHNYFLSNCIVFAFQRKVKLLEVDFSDPSWVDTGDYHRGFYNFPLDAIRHEIEGLRLFSCTFSYPPNGRMLNTLKTLSLGWIELPASHLKSFLTFCPSLESLALTKCEHVGFLEISGPRLKRLVIDKCEISLEAGILINAKSLHFFHYVGRVIPIRKEESLTALEEVILNFGIETELANGRGQQIYNLLKEIWSVRILTVCGYALQAISTANDAFLLERQLERVVQLNLKPATLTEVEYHGLAFFLNNCPNLEALSIDAKSTRLFRDLLPIHNLTLSQFISDKPYLIAFKCVRNTLKVVEVQDYKGYLCTERVLTYLLRYGCVLEKMSIRVAEHDRQSNLELAQRLLCLLCFPRANPNVCISIT